jgi:tetratricopeptide (TPR) repeat protein
MTDPSDHERDAAIGKTRGLFWLIALALPIVLLVGIETGLRIAGIAAPEPLFIPEPRHPEYSFTNPRVVSRFFARPELAPDLAVETGFFHTRRPPEGIRLVVQGGSSAAGFPYGYGASLAGMLEQRLRRRHPDRPVEVITTAMSAVNTWALADFVDEIIELAPDAVLIYAGHNEFLGIFGVGSVYAASSSPALTRWLLRIRNLRLYRVLEALLAREPPAESAAGTLMARIAGEKRIPLESPLFKRGTAQFEGNLARILGRYRSAGVPVYVATLASNERDQPPFESTDPGRDSVAWEAARQAFEAGRWSEAAERFAAVCETFPGSATCAWFLARALDRSAREEQAAVHYRRARDLDQLRFRAPTVFNDIIRNAAAESGVTLVDVHARFAAESPGGAVGANLMLEHLHPNLDGYFLLAAAFYDALVASDAFPAGRDISAATAREEIPLSEGERWFARYKLERLLNNWPFTDTPREPVLPPARSVPEELAQDLYNRQTDWLTMQRQLKTFYRTRGDADEYRRVTTILADAFPFVASAQLEAGELLLGQSRPLDSLRYLHRAVQYGQDDAGAAYLALADGYAKAGFPGRARVVLEELLARQPGNAAARERMDSLDQSG